MEKPSRRNLFDDDSEEAEDDYKPGAETTTPTTAPVEQPVPEVQEPEPVAQMQEVEEDEYVPPVEEEYQPQPAAQQEDEYTIPGTDSQPAYQEPAAHEEPA